MFNQRTWILITLYLILFLNFLGYFLTIPVLTEVIANPKFNLISEKYRALFGDYIFSIVLGVGSLAGFFFGPILGRLSDQIGRRKVLFICLFLTLISLILPIMGLVSSSIGLFALGNFFNGIASNNQPITQAAITDLSFQTQRKAWRFALDTVVICAAMTLGPVLGEVLSDPSLSRWFTPNFPFFMAAILTVIAILLAFFLLKETNFITEKNKTNNKNKKWMSVGFKSFSDVLNIPVKIKKLLLVFVLAQTGWAAFFQYLYLYLSVHQGFSEKTLSVYMGLIGVYFILGLLLIYPWVLKYFSLMQGVRICLWLSFLSFFGLIIFKQNLALWLLPIPLTLGMGLYFPSLLTLFSDETEKNNQGWILAVATSLIGVAWFVTGFSSIYLGHLGAQYPMVFSTACLFFSAVLAGVKWKI